MVLDDFFYKNNFFEGVKINVFREFFFDFTNQITTSIFNSLVMVF
jgi:hypothetical protein